MIKLIGFEIYGHSLFKDGTLFSIRTENKNTKQSKNRVSHLNQSLSINKIIGIVGINATGKSTLMRIFNGLNDLYLLDRSIDQTELDKALRSKNGFIQVKAFLASDDNKIFKINTDFKEIHNEDNVSWIITDEKIFKKKAKYISKNEYFSFDEKNAECLSKNEEFSFDKKKYFDRNKSLSEQSKSVIKPNDSVFRIVLNDTDKRGLVLSTVEITDVNVPRTFVDQTPRELLKYLDPSIEYLTYKRNKKGKIISCSLKFKNSNEVIHGSNFREVTSYLSSGTIKGITLFFEFVVALRKGATLLVDEIELHINKQIARDFIGLFSDPTINKNGATLIYSTHYIELTDDLRRNDEEYILKRDTYSELTRLSDKINRNDLKNSEFFQNNMLGGTAPSYSRLQKLKNSIRRTMR